MDIFAKKEDMTGYSFTLYAHSGIRWLAFTLAIIVVIKSLVGLFGGSKYSKIDNITGASFVGFMHLNLLLGFILYFFLSPLTSTAFMDFGSAMKDDQLRFWAVEHITLMILSVAAAQIGRSISKKAEDDGVKFRFQSIFYGISLLLMVFGIPWDRI